MSNTLKFVYGSDEYNEYMQNKAKDKLYSSLEIDPEQIKNFNREQRRKFIKKHQMAIFNMIDDLFHEALNDEILATSTEGGIIEK